MATEFKVLFKDFLQNKARDTNLATRYTPDALSDLLSGWLKDVREIFRDIAISNSDESGNKMEDVVESTRSMYEYTFSGTSNTTTLNPAPDTGSIIFVRLNNSGTYSDFTFNSSTNELEIINAPDQENDVYVGAYTDGSFNQTLNLTEQRVMVDGMQIVFADVQTMNEKVLNQRVYGKDYGLHSQANHIKAMEELTDKRYMRIQQRINLYSYRQDPDELSMLGGNQ